MASRHKVVKLRSRNRHATVTPLQRPKPSAPWQLDLVNERLRRGDETIALPPKSFAVLRYLSEHPNRLVTKQELLDAVWPDIAVTEAVLKNCILKLREALDDDAKSPHYIETIHRRGYRLLTPLTPTPPVSSSEFLVSGHKSQQRETRNQKPETYLVGRDTELSQLHGWLEKARNGERQVVFVSGEAGIGKTTVVEAFLKQVAAEGNLWIGRGQCIEHYGAGEGYMPVLEALGRLCREPGREELIPLLSQYAPTWLAQMPALLSTADLDALQRKVAGVTRERMLREMAEALEALTAKRPLVLLLEDLHWSDVSTLELLSILARRHEAARLLVLGTYRPVEMLANGHPLRTVKQELQQHRQCEEQRLDFLTEAHVAEYLARRFEGGVRRAAPLQELARAVHQRTEGNALFMVNVVEYLLPQGDLEEAGENVQVGMPSDLRQMIEEQIHRLSLAEQRMLEVASVAGAECSAAAIAAGLGATVEEVEAQCEGLARREQFLRRQGKEEWPDGIVAARYSFLHALYQEALYERVTVARRSSLHRRIGERQEQAYGERAKELAAELAVHFERGREYRKAVQYLQYAGENALRRSANQEAVSLLTTGLELLKTLPDTPERTQQELTLQLALGNALITVKGYTAPDVEKTYTRARELCQQLGETLQLVPVLSRLVLFYFDRGEFRTARELAEQALRLAQSVQDRYLLSLAHMALGFTLHQVGEFTSAQPHLEQALAWYDPQQHPRLTVPRGDPRVECLCFATWNLWFLGYPDQALKRIEEAVALAVELSHPFSLAYALCHAALFDLNRREEQLAREGAEAVITLATEQGFPYFLARGTVTRGAALAAQGQVEEGIAQMQQGLAALQAMGAEDSRLSDLPGLAIAYWRMGRIEEGLAVLAEALAVVDKTGERLNETGMYIVKGLLLFARAGENHAEAEACFRQAIAIARRQSARSVELLAVMFLSRLWQTQGKKKEAHRMLAEIYGWFTEGFDTKDLQDAKALLEELQD